MTIMINLLGFSHRYQHIYVFIHLQSTTSTTDTTFEALLIKAEASSQ